MLNIRRTSVVFALLLSSVTLTAQQATSGTFTLHKFAKAIGQESYVIAREGETATLTSHFLFTDRGTAVPLETKFVTGTSDGAVISFAAKGRSSRFAEMEDSVTVSSATLSINRSGKTTTVTPAGPWFVTDGYSPVAMQEQMMRWWLNHGKPEVFTVYPAGAQVRIVPAGTLTIEGKPTHGYTVAGLVWGQESLWMDDNQNLLALVSTDAEFDHFEAVREPLEAHLGEFIAAAVQSNLAALDKLTAESRMAPASKLAIVGATLEDSNGEVIPGSTILIEKGRIKAAGPSAKIHIPTDAVQLDAHGKFAIPGLWDMHAHYEQVEWGPIYLAAGVTSVRDVGNEFDFIRALHDQLDRAQNPAIGPHLEFAGIIDGPGPGSLGAVTADTSEQARAWVQKYQAAGARQIKIYSSVKPEIVRAVPEAAHQRGMTVTGHIPDGMTAIEGINDGMDQINHIQYELPDFTLPATLPDGTPNRKAIAVLDIDGPRAKALIAVLKAHHTVLDPTMALFETFNNSVPLDQLEPGVDHLPPQLREALDSPPATADRAKFVTARWQAMMATLRALHQAGIPIVAGTDQTIPGYSLHRELEIYVQAGFTPLEALQSATIVAARALGVESESGSIAPGKRGDVVLLDADPLADIHNTRRVFRTIADGAVYTPAPLWRSVDFIP